MKKTTLLLLLLIPIVGYAQTEQPLKQHKFGIGLGYNLNSVMGDTIRPVELSVRYRIKDRHTLQLYVPFLRENQSFRAEVSSFHSIGTVLKSKRNAIGIGIGYDYTVYSYSFVDLLVGARVEYLSFNYETDMSNSHVWNKPETGHPYDALDYTYYSNKGNWFGISPEIGIRTEWNKLFFDAKFLLSGIFLKKEFYKRLKTDIDMQSKVESTEVDWTYPASESFKIKGALSLSVSYYF